MYRPRTPIRTIIVATIAVALIAACSIGGVLGAYGSAGSAGAPGGFFALHSSSLSVGVVATAGKQRALRTAAAMVAPIAVATASSSADESGEPLLGGGTLGKPFSLRLRL